MLKKLQSTKFQVWIVATVLLCFRIIPASIWLTVSLVYMGVKATQNVLLAKVKEGADVK